MTNDIKFMLLGIFLAIMSVGGFVLADEEEIFLILAIALPIAAIWTFVKGFMGNNKAQIANKSNDTSTELEQTLPTITEQQN